MPRYALGVGDRVKRKGDLPDRADSARRVRENVYGEVIAVLSESRYTVAWDDATKPDSNHEYHASRLNCICRATNAEGREDGPGVFRIHPDTQDESSSESDSSEEDEEDELSDDPLDLERDIVASPARRSPRRREAIGAAPARPRTHRERYANDTAELEKLRGIGVSFEAGVEDGRDAAE